MAGNEALPQATLRETVEAAFEEHVPETPAEAPLEVKDDRPRGPDGKFIAKTTELVEVEVKPEPEAQVELAPPVQRPKPPSSWKKDYHAHWEKLEPQVAEYINQRESEYAKGVSTYKQEYDRLAPIGEAIAPFLPDLQQHNIDPGRWISQLGNAHKVLATAPPEQKLGMFLKLANDYQVPLQQLFTQGQDGKVYFNPQVQPYQPQAPQVDVASIVEQKIAEVFSKQQIQGFGTEKDGAGQLLHPHYETVRETMAQLLDAGLANDLDSAYEAALRHPRHADIFDSMLKQRQEADAAEKAKKAAELARSARRSAVSPRTATPSGTPAGDKKGIRSHIEAAFDQHAEGRV